MPNTSTTLEWSPITNELKERDSVERRLAWLYKVPFYTLVYTTYATYDIPIWYISIRRYFQGFLLNFIIVKLFRI